MRDFNIAYGNSRLDKKWKNNTISWEDFIKKVSKTIRTTETVEEFRKLKKLEQDNIKDVGGFVAGHLKGGRRKKGMVLSRSMLTLDMDYATKDIWDEIVMFYSFTCLIYSTHKHTSDNPRLRLVIPLSRDVSEEEYPAVARMLAKIIGIDLFDDTTYQPHRLMYWPSTSVNGDFVFEKMDGVLLNPDDYLDMYDDWKDLSTHPLSSRQSEIVKNDIKTQADPLLKDGIIGAFCRAYSITDVIKTFLNDIYEPSVMDGRYDYIPADSSSGVVLFDDKFAYSHHATDPASGHLMNAFDLVRIHLFGDKDNRVKADTISTKLPSYKAMCDFAVNDEKVKAELILERKKSIKEDFENWEMGLELDKGGKIKDTLDNLVLIISNDEKLYPIAFNMHRDGIDVKGDIPWEQIKPGWNDSDNSSLKVYLSKTYGLYSPTKTKDALQAVAIKRAYHPVKEYLESLPDWDNKKRLDNLLIDYFGAEDNLYSKAVIRKTLVAAVARIYRPGIKFDSVLILNGPQGIGKSTFFSKLAGDWFSDSLTLTDMKDKSGPEKLQGYWILELGELAGMRKTDVETVKSFISRVDDKYRVSYGVSVENHPRQSIVVGSTNAESGFLRDVTGNRRFWPVRVSGNSKKKSWQITKDEVDQVWAEALALYKSGEKLYLEGSEAGLAIKEQADAMETDEREGLVRKYLDTLLPDNWNEMDLFERRSYLSGVDDIGKKGTIPREVVCNLEIWCECFGKEPSAMQKINSYEIASIMKKFSDWDKPRSDEQVSRNFSCYGKQRIYKKIK